VREDLTKTDDIEALRRLALEAWQRAEALQKQADALAQEKALLVSQTTELKAKNKALEDELAVLLQRISDLTCKLAAATNQDQRRQLELELRVLRQKLAQHAIETFGSTSERLPSPEKEETKGKRDKKQKGHGPTDQPQLPIVPVVHHLDAPDCTCPKCGGQLVEMPEQFETSELVVSVQRTFVIEEHRRQKYHCGGCEHIETALGPTKLIPGGRYDLSFVVTVALDKYLDAIPLERQVRRMARAGLVVTSQTLWDQLVALYHVLLPTWLALKQRVLSSEVLFADETSWRMMGTGATKKWWLWTLTSADAVYFELFPTRGKVAARALFEDYAGIVMADGYAVYESLEQALTKKGGAQVDLDGHAEVLPNYTLALCDPSAEVGGQEVLSG
jgi:transposase